MRSTAILVSWRPPPPETHNGALVGYSVRYRPLGSEDPDPKEVNNIPPTTTQILLEALEKWTEYRVTAVAYTEVGPGPESSPVVVRTDEDGKHRPWPDPGLRPPTGWGQSGSQEARSELYLRGPRHRCPAPGRPPSQGRLRGGLLNPSFRLRGPASSCLEAGGHLHQQTPSVAC